MKKFLMAGILVTGLVIVNPAVVLACPHQKAEHAKHASKSQEWKITKLKKKVKSLWIYQGALGISEKQLNKVKNIKYKAIKELIRLNADKEIVMVDLRVAMREELMDVGAMNKLIDAKYGSKSKMFKVYIKAIGDIQKVLSKEQRAQWHEISAKSKFGETDCAKCAASSRDKFCPLAGKGYGDKGSSKGSMK